MSDQKPLRQEEYQAMAARVQELERQLAEQKVKLSKEPWWSMPNINLEWLRLPRVSVFGWFMIVGCALAAFLVVVSVLGDINNGTKVKCYSIGRTANGDPWDPYYLWEHRHWAWEHTTRSSTARVFSTLEDGEAFIKQYSLKRCE